MRRLKRRWVVAGLVVLAAAGAVTLWPRPERITRENYECIRDGMSRAEVEAVLGPPGDYRTAPTEAPPLLGGDFGPALIVMHSTAIDAIEIHSAATTPVEKLVWHGDQGNIKVWIDSDGVASRSFSVRQKVAQSHLDNLLWRAKRQWRKWFPE
jgi:hypothetical protein